MDVARRWQVVTVVTAATGIGLGGLALGHQPSASVPPIELEPTGSVPAPVDEPETPDGGPDAPADGSVPDDPEIVSPEVRSLDDAPDRDDEDDEDDDAEASTAPASSRGGSDTSGSPARSAGSGEAGSVSSSASVASAPEPSADGSSDSAESADD